MNNVLLCIIRVVKITTDESFLLVEMIKYHIIDSTVIYSCWKDLYSSTLVCRKNYVMHLLLLEK